MNNDRSFWTPAKIRELRKRYGETQEEFALRLRLTGESIRHWEARRGKPSGPATIVLDLLLDEINERQPRQLQTA